MMAETNGRAKGRVVRVIGPVVDVEFPPAELPEINTALTLDVDLGGETTTITCEVAQHIGDATVRAIALKPTDGVVRRARREHWLPDHRAGGRGVCSVTSTTCSGAARHDRRPDDPDTYWPIHRDAPPFADLEPKKVMLETGIKVIDLLEPCRVARSACSAVLASARP